VAHGPQNVWICEVGSRRLNGSFEAFLQTVADSGNVKNNVVDHTLCTRVAIPDLNFEWGPDPTREVLITKS